MKFIFDVHIERLKTKKILLLDRDGVVIKDTGYPYLQSDIIFEEEKINKIKKIIKQYGFDTCGFITNQSGVSRGYFTEKQFWNCHNYILSKCSEYNLIINFTAVNFFKKPSYFRKPETG